VYDEENLLCYSVKLVAVSSQKNSIEICYAQFLSHPAGTERQIDTQTDTTDCIFLLAEVTILSLDGEFISCTYDGEVGVGLTQLLHETVSPEVSDTSATLSHT